MAARQIPWISPDEFLDAEELSDTKHSYHNGIVTAMAGGSYAHGRLAGNLLGSLFAALRGRNCAVVGSDVKLHAGDSFVYPDLMVIRGLASKIPARPSVITNPVLIAEVLSPGTEAYDRGEKARLYRASPTVKQYALLSQDQPLIEIHTRHDDGTWRITEVSGLESVCEFSSLDCRIPFSDLYEGVLDA